MANINNNIVNISTIYYNKNSIYEEVSTVYSIRIRKEIEEAKDGTIWIYSRVSKRPEPRATTDSDKRTRGSGKQYIYRQNVWKGF